MVKKRSKKNLVKNSRKTSRPLREGRERPLSVTLVSVLWYLEAAFFFLIGLIFIIGSIIGTTFLLSVGAEQLLLQVGESNDFISKALLGVFLGGAFIGGVAMIIWSLITFTIARALWKGRNWARLVTIILAGIWFIGSIFSLDIVGLVLSGVVGYYLWFDPRTKAYFL